MGRPCECCRSNKKVIAWIGAPLPIFEQAITKDYTDIDYVIINNSTSTTWSAEDVAGGNMDHSSLASQGYSYVPYQASDIRKYLGVTIGTAYCGSYEVARYVGMDTTTVLNGGDPSIFEQSAIMTSLKEFIQKGQQDQFIFWHGEWDNWYYALPEKLDDAGCFSTEDAEFYSLMAEYLGLSTRFLSTSTSPNKDVRYDHLSYGVSKHTTSIPFLEDFFDDRLFLTAATGAISGGLRPILWADRSIQQKGGQAGYYGIINQKGLKMVVVMDSNFCTLDVGGLNFFRIDGTYYYPERINPLFAKALILFAGR